jgi:hypothetical protein
VRLDPGSNVNLVIELPERESECNSTTEGGRQSNFSDAQPRNAKGSTSVSVEFGSNDRFAIELPDKQSGQNREKEGGRERDVSDEHPQNANASIQRNRDGEEKLSFRS